jgi:hypothetical protein
MQSTTTDDSLETSKSRWSSLSPVGFGVLVGLALFFALVPLLWVGALYAASWRAAALIGHWPVAWADDPWYGMPDDGLYPFLYLSVPVFYVVSITAWVAVPSFTVLIALVRPKFPKLWLAFLGLAFVAGWFLGMSDPGDRMRWWLD